MRLDCAQPESTRSAEMFKPILTSILIALMHQASIAAQPWQLQGKITYVEDGDTLTLMQADYSRYSIRLTDIDAPETSHGPSRLGQPFSQVSKNSLTALAIGKQAVATCFEYDVHQTRPVCAVDVGGVDLSMEQIRRGMVWVYRSHPKYVRRTASFTLEDQARAARVGIWAEPGSKPIPPWEWRKQCWKNAQCAGAGQ